MDTKKIKIIGPCPICGADVILHASKKYYVCSRRLEDGKCNFTLNNFYLKKFGKKIIGTSNVTQLLEGIVLISNNFLDPISHKQLNCPCEIRLDFIPDTGRYGIDVKILWNKNI